MVRWSRCGRVGTHGWSNSQGMAGRSMERGRIGDQRGVKDCWSLCGRVLETNGGSEVVVRHDQVKHVGGQKMAGCMDQGMVRD